MKREKLLIVLTLIFGLFAFTACQDNNQQNAEGEDVETQADTRTYLERQKDGENNVEVTIKGTPELSTFSNRLDVAEIDDDLDTGGPYTVFAPNNEAYSYLYREHGENALVDINHEDEIGFLIIEGKYTTDSLRQGLEENNGTFTLPTLQGEHIIISMTDNEIFIRGRAGSGGKIIESDINATNGVVHIIETVILPGDIETKVRLTEGQQQDQ